MSSGLLATVPNPFSHGRVDSAWEAPADVPGIHGAAFEQCLRLVEEVARDRQSHGAILAGQPGAGKTHVLSRLRRQVVDGERGWFVYVRPITGPDRFFRHLLHELAGDILRPPHGAVSVSQLEVALARHVMADAAAPAVSVDRWWAEARARHASPEALAAHLRDVLEPVADALRLDLQVFRVVLNLAARQHRLPARAWLLGRAIGEDDCRLLGTAGSLDDEAAAEEAVVTLLALAGEGFPVVLAFDQIEGLQRTRDDTEGLMAFAHGVAQVFSRARNAAALTCVQVAFLDDLRRAVGEALFDGRLAERGEASLRPLTATESLALVRRRAEVCTDLQMVRLYERQRRPDLAGVSEPLWPLLASEVESLAMQPDATPREILRLGRALFDERARGAAPVASAASLDSLWEATIDEERHKPVDVIDEGVYVDGLLRVLDATGVRAERSRVKDVDLEVSAEAGRVGVSVCNAEHMASLAGRLRRLLEGAARTRVDRLCLVRDARLPIKPTARATRTYLEQLQHAGAALSRPPAEAYVALAAIRNLLAQSAAGDLTLDGRPVAPQALKDWLAQNVPAPVADLIQDVVGPARAADSDGLRDRLLAVMVRVKLAELEAVAREAEASPEAVRSVVAESAMGVAAIAGTPTLLFLHPDAVERA